MKLCRIYIKLVLISRFFVMIYIKPPIGMLIGIFLIAVQIQRS